MSNKVKIIITVIALFNDCTIIKVELSVQI